MAEDKSSSSFVWLLVLFFVCPLLCCGILSSNSSLFEAPTAVPTGGFTQVPLLSYLNDNGIGNAPGQANFDGSGYSYPASQLPPGGLRLLGGVPYQFLNSTAGANDNIAALGQVIKLTPGNYQRALLLVATSWGLANNTMTVTVHYTDGSTSSGTFNSPDWDIGPSGVVNVSRYSPTGIEGPANIYAVQIALDKAKTADSLTLPTTAQPEPNILCLHVFSLTLQYAA